MHNIVLPILVYNIVYSLLRRFHIDYVVPMAVCTSAAGLIR